MLKGLEGWGAEGGTEEDSVEPGGWHRTTFSSWQGLGSSSWDQTEAGEGKCAGAMARFLTGKQSLWFCAGLRTGEIKMRCGWPHQELP